MTKKITWALMAVLFLLGTAQCKKENQNNNAEVPPVEIDGDMVYITLTVNNGARHNVFTESGIVQYTEGDIIHVGNNGKYVGQLAYSNGTFGGAISESLLSTQDYLHFYFVGGLETGDLSPGTTTSFAVNISNQTQRLPVLSYGRSDEKYYAGTTNYRCTLLNKCALVRFELGVGTTKTVYVGGLKTEAFIDFSDPGIRPTSTTGSVSLYRTPESYEYPDEQKSCEERWAILLPGSHSNPTVSIDGFTNCSTFAHITCVENQFITGDETVDIHNYEVAYPDRLRSFTVSSNLNTVFFSHGNLQYKASNGEFRFAKNPWDYVGDANFGTVYANGVKCNNALIADGYEGWIDLFGWGTWGKDKNPTQTSIGDSDYYPWSEFDDAITLADKDSWRTLSFEEWYYLLFGRKNDGFTQCFAKACVNGVCGLILFPDGWYGGDPSANPPYVEIVDDINASYYSTVISAADWHEFHVCGAVFLPAAGFRDGDVVSLDVDTGSNELGSYWSSNWNGSDSFQHLGLTMSETDLILNNVGLGSPSHGSSVRLVRDVQ